MPPTPVEVSRILLTYDVLYDSINIKAGPDKPILLAHYTSVQVIEQILKNNEIWFANPLYMNDLSEMRAGLLIGNQLFLEFAQKAEGTTSRVTQLVQNFNHYMAHLSTEAILDTYIFCMSEHPVGDTDGRLSMWREYGSKGNGAALVVNTQRLHYQPHSPLTVAKVAYRSSAEHESALRTQLQRWADITLSAKLPDDHLYLASYAAFGYVKAFALVTKHSGFAEENEWRVVYVPERDPLGYLKPCFGYFVGPRGVEPKLRYKFDQIYNPDSSKTGDQLTSGRLIDILEFVMLGPSVSSPLARAAFVRMLEQNGKGAMRDKVFSSTIPLRPAP